MTTTASTPQARQPARRPPAGARRLGYLISVTINVGLVWFVNVAPGWRWLPFLSEDFTVVLGVLNAALVVGVAVNLAFVVADPPVLRRLGDAVTAAFAAAVLYRLAAVFPFDFVQRWSWLQGPLRVALVLATLGTAVAVIVNVIQAIRHAQGR